MQSRPVIPSERQRVEESIVAIEGPFCPYDRDSSCAQRAPARLRRSARNDTYPAVLQYIRKIVLPTGPGAMNSTDDRVTPHARP